MTSTSETIPNLAFAATDRVMIFAPHPDDEALGNAALIQVARAAGAQVRVVFVTDGESNPWPQRYVERRWFIDADCRLRWGVRRRAESLRALETLGLLPTDAIFLGLPDQGLTKLWEQLDQRALHLHVAELRAFQPTMVIVPSHDDNHPDHTGSLAIIQHAMKLAEVNVPQWAYLIHRRWFHPHAKGCALHLTQKQKAAKLAAIQCHETQLSLSRGRFCAYARDQEIFTLVHA
jgi:LmbE family N-acetylglucosaminyl deacetylase